MALTGPEGLVDAIKTFIEANLPATLDALDTEYTDTIVLRDIVRTYVGTKSLKSIPFYPAMYIYSPSDRTRVQTVVPGTTQAVIEAKPRVTIGIVETDMDSEVLERRMYRYDRAIKQLLLEAMASGSALSGWSLATDEEWERETAAAQTESESVGGTELTVRANKIEQR